MTTSRALACLLSLATAAGCSGTFGGVGRSTRISDSARITAGSIVPDDATNRGVIEHLALAEEVYSKTLDALRERRNTLRSRRRALTLGGYATFAATTLVIGAAAISKSNSGDSMSTDGMRTAGYGALGGLGVGTTLEVMNLMQEDPSNVETKIHQLQASYDNMIDRLHVVFEQRPEVRPAAEGAAPGARTVTDSSLEVAASPIIEAFINEALQINVKG